MVSIQLVASVNSFATWGLVIVGILWIIEFFRFWGAGKETPAEAVKSSPNWLTRRIKRGIHKSKVASLNEYVEEQKEAGLIDHVIKFRAEAVDKVQDIRGLLKFPFNALGKTGEITIALETLTANLDAALEEFRKLRGRTWRQEKRTGKLLEALEEKKIDVTDIKNYEDDVIARHKTAEDNLQKARKHIKEKVDAKFDALTKLPALARTKGKKWPVPFARGTGDPVDNVLIELVAALEDKNLKGRLEAADKAEHEALKDVQGIIAKARPLWNE